MYTTYENALFPGWMLAVNDEAELSAAMIEDGWLLSFRMSRDDLESMTQELGAHTIGDETFCLFKTGQNQKIYRSSLGGALAAALMFAEYQRQNASDCAAWLRAKMVAFQFNELSPRPSQNLNP